jgi:hypothetical protein
MKKTLGILLIMIGAGMMSFEGCSHNSGKSLDANGMIREVPKHQSSVNWIPYTGALVFISGVILTTRKK